MGKLSIKDVLDYEVHSNWLAAYVFFGWGQDIIGWYIGQKVKRKYKRYLASVEFGQQILEKQKKLKLNNNAKPKQNI